MVPIRIAALVLIVLWAPLQVLYIYQTSARLPFGATSLGCAMIIVSLFVLPLRYFTFKSSVGIGLTACLVVFGVCVLHRVHGVVIFAIPFLNILVLASNRWPRVEEYALLIVVSFSIAVAAQALATAPALAIQIIASDLPNVNQVIWKLFDGYLVDISVAAAAVIPSIGVAFATRYCNQSNNSSGSSAV